MDKLKDLQVSASYYWKMYQLAGSQEEKRSYKQVYDELLERYRQHKEWLQIVGANS